MRMTLPGAAQSPSIKARQHPAVSVLCPGYDVGATYADLVSVDVIIVRTVVVHVLSVHHTSVWRYTQDYRPKTSFGENRHGAERFRP
jgi:hypothetical protein